MERIGLIARAVLLDIMGTSIICAEGAIQAQLVLLEKFRDLARGYARRTAGAIAVSSGATEREKTQIAAIMRRIDATAREKHDEEISEEMVIALLEQLEREGLVRRIEKEEDRPAVKNSGVDFPRTERLEFSEQLMRETEDGDECPLCGCGTVEHVGGYVSCRGECGVSVAFNPEE